MQSSCIAPRTRAAAVADVMARSRNRTFYISGISTKSRRLHRPILPTRCARIRMSYRQRRRRQVLRRFVSTSSIAPTHSSCFKTRRCARVCVSRSIVETCFDCNRASAHPRRPYKRMRARTRRTHCFASRPSHASDRMDSIVGRMRESEQPHHWHLRHPQRRPHRCHPFPLLQRVPLRLLLLPLVPPLAPLRRPTRVMP